MAHTIALFSGLFTFTAGLLRLGFLDSILSKPMSAGFVTAVAFVVMIEQVFFFFFFVFKYFQI